MNYLKCACIQTVQAIELKFSMNNISYFVVCCVDFGEYRFNGIFAGAKGIILIHYSQWS